MPIGMNIQNAEIQENALKLKIQLKIKDFFQYLHNIYYPLNSG